MASTYTNRALTLATLGVLSGVAVTLATAGVIQLPEEEPVTPVVEVPDSYRDAGGFRSIPDREFHVSLRGEYHETDWFVVADRSTFNAIPALRDATATVAQSLTLFLWDETRFSRYSRASDPDLFVLADSTSSAFSTVYRAWGRDAVQVQEHGTVSYFTTEPATSIRFDDFLSLSVQLQVTTAFHVEPYTPFEAAVAEQVLYRITDSSSNDFSRSRSFASVDAVVLPLAVAEDLSFVGSTFSYRVLTVLDSLWVKDHSITTFATGFIELADATERMLLLFAHALLSSEDD